MLHGYTYATSNMDLFANCVKHKNVDLSPSAKKLFQTAYRSADDYADVLMLFLSRLRHNYIVLYFILETRSRSHSTHYDTDNVSKACILENRPA